MKYTIAILDEEKKERGLFVNFFEEEFNVIEIPYVSSIDDLIETIKSENIDAIAIDYQLKDHHSKFKENGDFFFKQLISRLHDFPSFVLTQDPESAKKKSKLIKPRFIVGKDVLHSQDPRRIKEFKEDIESEIVTYKTIMDEKLRRLKELEVLEKTKGLDNKLENEYLYLNNEISQLITGYESLPLKYFSKETNEKLDEIISKTDKLIKKISKNK